MVATIYVIFSQDEASDSTPPSCAHFYPSPDDIAMSPYGDSLENTPRLPYRKNGELNRNNYPFLNPLSPPALSLFQQFPVAAMLSMGVPPTMIPLAALTLSGMLPETSFPSLFPPKATSPLVPSSSTSSLLFPGGTIDESLPRQGAVFNYQHQLK